MSREIAYIHLKIKKMERMPGRWGLLHTWILKYHGHLQMRKGFQEDKIMFPCMDY